MEVEWVWNAGGMEGGPAERWHTVFGGDENNVLIF